MIDCPRFDACEAPICPLDPDKYESVYLKGEKTCHFMRAYSRGETGTIPAHIMESLGKHYLPLLAQYGPLKRRIERGNEALSLPSGLA